MTKKEVTLVVISSVILLVSVYFMYTLLFPAKKSNTTDGNGSKAANSTITGKIDEDTLNKVKTYKDYGAATLDNIGRVNPFGPLN